MGTRETRSDIDGPYAWRRLGLSVVLSTLGGAGMWAVVVVLPAVQDEFGVARADASLPYTMTMVGFAAGNVVIGRLVDRMGFMTPALVASLALGAGFVLAAMAGSITQFALVQGILIGVGSSAPLGLCLPTSRIGSGAGAGSPWRLPQAETIWRARSGLSQCRVSSRHTVGGGLIWASASFCYWPWFRWS